MIRLKRLLTETSLSTDNTFRELVKGWEGTGPMVNGMHVAYDDASPKVATKSNSSIRGTLTIGYGTTKTVYPELKPGMKISTKKAEELLTKGIVEHEAKARRLVKKFDSYPAYVRQAILNAVYRGDLGPKTAEAINSGQWSKVSGMYLDHPNYKNPGKFPGVVKRMKSNAEAFDKYAMELTAGGSKQTTNKTTKTTTTSTSTDSMVGKTIYPKPGTGYANIRETPVVDNGIFDDNQSGVVRYPNAIGVVRKVTKGQDSKTWYFVKLATGGFGYVRSNVVKTTNSKYHVVKPGETLIQIAKDNGLRLDDLQGVNQNSLNDIYPGQKIRLI